MIFCGIRHQGPCLEHWAPAESSVIFIATASACPLACNPIQEHCGLPRTSGQSPKLVLPKITPSVLPVGNNQRSLRPYIAHTPASSLRPRSLGSQAPSGSFCLSGTLMSLNVSCPCSGIPLPSHPKVWARNPLLPRAQESKPLPLFLQTQEFRSPAPSSLTPRSSGLQFELFPPLNPTLAAASGKK